MSTKRERLMSEPQKMLKILVIDGINLVAMINTHLSIRNVLPKWGLPISYLGLPDKAYNQQFFNKVPLSYHCLLDNST